MTSWHLLVSKTPLLRLDLSGVHKVPIAYHDPKSGMRLAERGREREQIAVCLLLGHLVKQHDMYYFIKSSCCICHNRSQG